MKISKSTAILELLLAGAIWGFGFTANEWAQVGLSSYEILFFRFILAAAAGEAIRFLIFKSPVRFHFEDMKLAIPAGIILSIFLIFQTVGMEFTTATNSGFITTLKPYTK